MRIKINPPIKSCYHCEQETMKLNWCKVYIENIDVFKENLIHECYVEPSDDCMKLLENIQKGIELCDDCYGVILFRFGLLGQIIIDSNRNKYNKK